jgi:hypothetical protein
MGSGSFSTLGSVSCFTASPVRKGRGVGRTSASANGAGSSFSKQHQQQQHAAISEPPLTTATTPVVFTRRLSSFLRVADLQMDETMSLHANENLNEHSNSNEHPNFHHVAINPPPGMAEDPLERWVVLDDGAGGHAPIAPFAVRALAKIGYESALNQSMWTPDHKTTVKIQHHDSTGLGAGWHKSTWLPGVVPVCTSNDNANANTTRDEQSVLVWSGSFQHGLYGSDLSAVRTAGFMNMSAVSLMNLLVDSTRVKEYNKLSLGRTDILVLQEGMDTDTEMAGGPFGGITKVMKSESRPPMIRRTLQFISILHATELQDGSGYLIVTRAVTTPPEDTGTSLQNVLKSEILMGVNIIKRVEGDADRCLLICVNQIRSPMIPMMIAKRIGLQAAVNFIQDLRACC